MPLHDLHFMLSANVADQIPHPRSHFPTQRRFAVLGGEHHMQMNLEYRMRAAAIVWHPPSLSGGALDGFNPPRRRQSKQLSNPSPLQRYYPSGTLKRSVLDGDEDTNRARTLRDKKC